MPELSRQQNLESIRGQLDDWQHNLSVRVAGEAQALDLELEKVRDNEIEEVWNALRTGQQNVLDGCDKLRDLRRRLQDRPQAAVTD